MQTGKNEIDSPVTEEDEHSEQIIIAEILTAFPDHAILSEETGAKETASDYKWIIDPIDGTNNFVDGRENFSVSIGLEYRGEIILGVVYLPVCQELFTAEKDKGAFLNGQKIKVGSIVDLREAVITMSSFPNYKEEETWINYLNQKILPKIPRAKYFGYQNKKDVDPMFGRGSMAAELCFLACGRIDGMIRLKQKPWDVAAGSLIASEAGAVLTNLQGELTSIYEGTYVAANKKLHPQMLELVK